MAVFSQTIADTNNDGYEIPSAAGWTAYTAPFVSGQYVQIRIEAA